MYLMTLFFHYFVKYSLLTKNSPLKYQVQNNVANSSTERGIFKVNSRKLNLKFKTPLSVISEDLATLGPFMSFLNRKVVCLLK
jgi:hypothetical protein